MPMKPIARIGLILIAVLLCLYLAAVGAYHLLPPDFRGQRFHNAARDGDITRARFLLLLGSDIDYRTGIGTALHIASMRGDTAFMEFLLRHGAAPDLSAKFGVTPLYFARTYKHPDAERILLAHGANPDTSNINPP